jgi:hypothetical protein
MAFAVQLLYVPVCVLTKISVLMTYLRELLPSRNQLYVNESLFI